MPLHGYSFESPLWAGITCCPPAPFGFLAAAPSPARCPDRFQGRPFTVGGMVLMAVTFAALLLIPVNFDYRCSRCWCSSTDSAAACFAPNTRGHHPASRPRPAVAASAMSGHVLQRGLFAVDRHLLLAGLSGAATLPDAMSRGLQQRGVSAAVANGWPTHAAGGRPVRGIPRMQPVAELLAPHNALQQPGVNAEVLTSKTFLNLIIEPFHSGLEVVFGAATLMMVIARSRDVPAPVDTAAPTPTVAAGRG